MQVLAFDQLQHEKMRTAMLVGVECGDDSRMRQPGDGFHFSLKPIDRVRLLSERCRQFFEGDDSSHPTVLSPKHRTLAAVSQNLLQLIISQHEQRTLFCK